MGHKPGNAGSTARLALSEAQASGLLSLPRAPGFLGGTAAKADGDGRQSRSSVRPGGNRTSWKAKMKRLGLFAALPAAMLLAGAASMTAALADDPILTKAPPPVSAPPGPTSCDSVPAFFLSTSIGVVRGQVLRGDRRSWRLPNQRRPV